MKKILNWTFGACFRTLGRFLAIFIVFALLLFVGSKLDIEIPSWLGLKVNASDIFMNNWADGLPNISRVDIRGCDKEKYSSTFDTYQCDNNSSELDSVRSYFSTGSGFREYVQNSYAWTIGTNGYSVGTASRTKKNYLYQVNYYYCSSTWVNDYTDTFITMGAHAQKNQDAIYYTDLMQFVGNQPGAYNENYTNYYKGDWTACYRLTALIVPKSDSANINFRIRQTSGTISNYYHQFISLEVNELGLWNGALETIIENSGFAKATDVQQVETAVNEVKQEVQELNNSIDETNATIKDDDTSGAEDSVGGFFDDFQSEDFGLSSIVTAPLRGINAMLNDTCIAPSATYKGQTFSLPCGSMLWSRPGGEDFKSFINVMYGGFLAYLVIRKFFLDVEDLKNPNSDKVEVDKL